MVRATSARPVIDYLDRIGVRPGPALERARTLLRDPTKLIPVSHAGSLLEDAQQAAALDAFGLRLGEATRILELGEWGAVLRESITVAGTLRAAVTIATRFNSGQRFQVARTGDEIRFSLRISPCFGPARTTLAHFQLMLMLEGIRLAAGPRWRPTEIHLEGPPPAHAEELAAHAAKQIHFGRPCVELVFPADVLALRYPEFGAPASRFDGPVPGAAFEKACRQVVESLLALGTPELAAAAEMTRVSERSLQRGLAARGYTFKRLVETVRFESAVRMLDDPSAKIVEIALHLGYTDSANFTRAFRRWSGVSPQAFRMRAASGSRSRSPLGGIDRPSAEAAR